MVILINKSQISSASSNTGFFVSDDLFDPDQNDMTSRDIYTVLESVIGYNVTTS